MILSILGFKAEKIDHFCRSNVKMRCRIDIKDRIFSPPSLSNTFELTKFINVYSEWRCALSNTSTVNKSWNERSRRYLFANKTTRLASLSFVEATFPRPPFLDSSRTRHERRNPSRPHSLIFLDSWNLEELSLPHCDNTIRCLIIINWKEDEGELSWIIRIIKFL